ncbi:MAG: autotransporter, partial [Rariglobus sp.]|nr:autotransporter [Rariglobus sp.]
GTATNKLTLAGSHTITVNALGTGATASITGPIDGSVGLIKSGAGVLVLGGANTYTGGTTVSAGTLRITANTGLGSSIGGVTNGAITITSGATLQMATNAFAITLGGAISGSGTLDVANTGGTTSITNDNSATYSGQVRVQRSTLAVGHNGALGSGSLAFGVNDQGSTIRSTDGTARTLANVVSITGTTNSTYSLGSATTGLNGNLTFSDTTAIGLGSTVKKFQVYNRTQFNGGFTGSGGVTMQVGTGTLVLNGANTYTGVTTINAGTLLITGSKTGTGVVTVNSTGTLGGTGTVAGVATANAGSFLSAGASSAAAGTLTFSSTLDISGLAGGTGGLLFDLAGTGASDKIASGALTIGTGLLDLNDFSFTTLAGYGVGTYTLFDATSIVGTLGSSLTGTIGGLDAALSISGNDLILTVSAIPEPSTYAMIAGAGLLGFALYRRRRVRA